jgi:hypothetical protein
MDDDFGQLGTVDDYHCPNLVGLDVEGNTSIRL